MDETDLVSEKGEILVSNWIGAKQINNCTLLRLQPTEEMFEKSFNFRKDKLLRWAFE